MVKLIISVRDGEPEEYELTEDSYALGRSKKNDIVIPDPEASRKHAELTFDHDAGAWFVEDLESRNGVFLNDEMIRNRTILMHGDIIKIGEVCLEVDDSDALDPDEALTMLAVPLPDEGGTEDDETLVVQEEDGDVTTVLSSDDVLIPDQDSDPDATMIVKDDEDDYGYHRLIMLSDADFGREYKLQGLKAFIGSGKSCEIRLRAGTISEQHCSIAVNENECVLEDLRSTNGTFVNRIRISGEQNLKSGDDIGVGPYLLRFFDQNSVVKKDELKPVPVGSDTGRSWKLIFIAALVCACVVLVAFWQRPSSKNEKVDDSTTTELIEPFHGESEGASESEEEAQDDTLIAIHFESAEDFAKHAIWNKSIEKYQKVLLIDKQHAGALLGLQNARFELKNKEIMDNGMDLISMRKDKEGISVLESIPKDSFYSNRAFQEIQDVKWSVKKEKEAAFALRKRKEREAALLAAAQTPKKPHVVKPVKPGKDHEKKAGTLIDEALDTYATGKIKESLQILDTVTLLDIEAGNDLVLEASKLKDRISDVSDMYKAGLEQYRDGKISQAFKIWANTLTLDQKIVGARIGYYTKIILGYKADDFCRRATEEYERGNYAKVHENCNNALTADPEHDGVKKLRRTISERVRKLNSEAYAIAGMNPDIALNKWKEILSLCAPGDDYYEKAKAQILEREQRLDR